MVHLLLKNNIEQSKLDALLIFLKSWNIDAEIKKTASVSVKNKSKLSLAQGIWKDYDITAESLRNRA